MAHDVFISYAAEDRSAAEAARAALEAQDVSCWIAPRDVLPGEDETESILAAIDASSVVVVCLSSAANASKLVTQQAARAFNKRIPIVPLRVEDVGPSEALKLFLGAQEPVDAYTPPLESPLAALGVVIGSLLAQTAAPAAGIMSPPGLPYEEGTPAVRKRRGGAPPRRAGGKVLIIAALVALAIIVIAAIFFLLPQSQVQLIAVSSETPGESPSPTEKPTILPTQEPSLVPTPTTPTPTTPTPTTPTPTTPTPTTPTLPPYGAW